MLFIAWDAYSQMHEVADEDMSFEDYERAEEYMRFGLPL